MLRRPAGRVAVRPTVQAHLPALEPVAREGWTSDDWATPAALVRELETEFGPFDLDPCCRPETAKAARFYTREDDGLGQPWFGNVFLNPPYSAPRPWLERAAAVTSSGEAALVVALLPAAVDTGWFHDVVLPHAECRWLRGRVRFIGWLGTPLSQPIAPNFLAIFRAAA